MSAAFTQLHPKVQEAIYEMQWDSLRPLQVRAIHAVLQSQDHLILSAATASGKTEAAFLPVLSQLANAPANSVQALYISPLKALINDQFERLEALCEKAEIPVHRWHGDVSTTAKAKLRQEPRGVLLITPESMESLFINHDRHIAAMFSGLLFVVIDELHAFLDNVRGIHLRSVLARLELQAKVTPRRLGLSATLGDFTPAKAYLHPEDTSCVTVLEDDAGQRDLRVSVKSYFDAAGDKSDSGDLPAAQATGGLAAVATDIAKRFRQDSNLIFCNRRQDAEVLADKLHHIAEREHWPSDPFVLHHGSLSRELREETEADLKSSRAVTALCTSTLEMGIDLGSVRSVGQVDPPWSVASLVQRLGRSGRKEGQPQVLRLYALDTEPCPNSSLSDRLYRDLIRAIAMVELHLEKWLEPPAPERRHYSTCVHQTFSILKQTGGTTAAVLHDRLIARGAFAQIKTADFALLLRGLAAHELIEQMPNGVLILAPKGERIVESRDFYAAFMGSEDYTVEHAGTKLGVLPRTSVPPVDEHFLLAGKRWRVEAIEPEHRLVIVARSKGWKRPFFQGQAGDIHPRVLAKMREVLATDGGFAYLDANAAQRLAEARKAFTEAGLHHHALVQAETETLWFTWSGSAICLALQCYGRARGLKVSWDGLALCYERVTPTEFDAHRNDLASQPLHALIAGALTPNEVLQDRFDELVPMDLLKVAFIAERLDLQGAQAMAMKGFVQ